MKTDVSPWLIQYAEESVFSFYRGVDPAHDESHIRTVIGNALSLASTLEVDIDMVYCIALFHDIGIRFGREDHEITSARHLESEPIVRAHFSAEQIHVMKEAVEDHRASSSHPPRSIYGCVIAEADRDLDPTRILRRSLDFARAHHEDASEEELVQISAHHIAEKYGPNGYLKLYLHDPRNEQGLATLRSYVKDGSLAGRLRALLTEK